jgi:alanine dehydrogenase
MLDDGRRPLLAPMSQIAGHMAVLIGCQFLQRHRGGMGVMIGRVDGAPAPAVVILGGGSAGTRAAQAAGGLGASVSLYEVSAERRKRLRKMLPASVQVLALDKRGLAGRLREAALLINTTNVPEKTKSPLVTRAMVRRMPKGAVIVDVTANVRGAIETSLRQTSHSAPVFEEEGVLHYVVPNIPGSVPRTATLALTSATFPYLRTIADQGLAKSLLKDAALCRGLLCHAGWCTSRMLAELHGKEWRPAREALL